MSLPKVFQLRKILIRSLPERITGVRLLKVAGGKHAGGVPPVERAVTEVVLQVEVEHLDVWIVVRELAQRGVDGNVEAGRRRQQQQVDVSLGVQQRGRFDGARLPRVHHAIARRFHKEKCWSRMVALVKNLRCFR
jgi:hypothetical protein